MGKLIDDVTKILGPVKGRGPEGLAILKIAEAIEELQSNNRELDDRTGGLKRYGGPKSPRNR